MKRMVLAALTCAGLLAGCGAGGAPEGNSSVDLTEFWRS